MITLRVHHLLCTGFYKGSGYSEDFVKNMNVIVHRLREGTEKILLTTQCDDICEKCPNKDSEDDAVCTLNSNRVHIKDILLLHALQLTSSNAYEKKELGSILKKVLTQAIFENSCKNCDWFKKGFCKFENWKSPLDERLSIQNTIAKH